jgi:hypothetical protein
MELLFAVLGGILIGLFAHVVVPVRGTRGAVLAPAIGGIAAAVLWEVLIWSAWSPSDAWMWIVTFVVSALAAIGVAWGLGVRRDRSDTAFFTRMSTSDAR